MLKQSSFSHFFMCNWFFHPGELCLNHSHSPLRQLPQGCCFSVQGQAFCCFDWIWLCTLCQMWGTRCIKSRINNNLCLAFVVQITPFFAHPEICQGAVVHASGGINGATPDQAIWRKKKNRVDMSATCPPVVALVLNQMCASHLQWNPQSVCCAPHSFFQKQIALLTNGVNAFFQLD